MRFIKYYKLKRAKCISLFIPILIFVFVFFLFGAFNLFCVDFGGSIDNLSAVSTGAGAGEQEAYFSQIDKLSIWFDADLGKKLTFTIQGSYMFSLDIPYLFDIDLLELSGEFPSMPKSTLSADNGSRFMFNFTIGRFLVSDFSDNVLCHNIDGFKLGFNFPSAMLSVSLGYTGLLLKPTAKVIISKADEADENKNSIHFAPPRLIALLEVSMPELFFSQDFIVSLMLQQDLRPLFENYIDEEDRLIIEEGEVTDYGDERGGALSTQYIGMGLSGTIISSLYYNSFAYLGLGRTLTYSGSSYKYKPIVSFLGGFGLRYYMEKALFSRLNLKVLFSSGDSDHSTFIDGNTEDYSNTFITVSKQETALVFSPQLGNIFLIELNYSIKPLSALKGKAAQNLQTIFKVIPFFRTSTGPISESGINPESEALYLGTEIDCIINFRPFSDLGFALSTGVFIPNNGTDGAFFEDERSFEFMTQLEFSFSF